MRILLAILFLTICLRANAQRTGNAFGEITCAPDGKCYLQESRGTLSERRLLLMSLDGKAFFDPGPFRNNYVKLQGLVSKNELRVYGISLAIPDQLSIEKSE